MKYKKTLIFTVVITSVYLLFGFFIVPYFAKDRVVGFLESSLNRSVEIGKISFNPLLFQLNLDGVKINQKNSKKTFIEVQNIFIDIDVYDINRHYHLKAIEINSPTIFIIRDMNNSFNFSDLIGSSGEKQGDLPKILFEKVSISRGEVSYSDDGIEKKVTDLNYLLTNLKTYEGSARQELLLNFNNSKLFLKSSLQIDDLQIKGSLELSDLNIENFSNYYKDTLSVEPKAIIDLGVKFEYVDGAIFVEESNLEVKDIVLGEILKIAKIRVDGIRADVDKKEIDISKIELVDSFIDGVVDKNGTFNFSKLIKKSEGGKKSDKQWKVTLNQTNIKNLNINFSDKTYKEPFNIAFNSTDFNLSKFAINSGESSEFNINSKIDDNSSISLIGQFSLNPFKLNTKVALSNFDTLFLNQFIAKSTNLSIKSGRLDLNLTIDYDKNILIRDSSILVKSFVAFQDELRVIEIDSFRVDNILVDLYNNGIDIDKISLNGGEISGFIDKNEVISFQNIIKKSETKKDKKAKEWNIKVSKIETKRLNLNFEDRKKDVEFKLSDIDLIIDNFSNQKGNKFDININSKLFNTAINYSGKVALSPLYLNTEISFKNLDITKLEPYYRDKLNAKIKSAKLSFKSNIRYDKSFYLKNSYLSLHNLSIYQKKQRVFKLGSLYLNNLSLYPKKNRVWINSVSLNRGYIDSYMDKKGLFNLSKLTKKGKKDKNSWLLEINRIKAKQFFANFEDRSISGGQKIKISDVFLTIDKFSTKKNRKFKLSLDSKVMNSPVGIKSTISLEPIFVDGKISLKSFDIAKLNSYIKKYLNIDLKSAKLGVEARVIYKKNLELYSTVKLTKVKINDLKKSRLFSTKVLSIENLKYKKESLDIDRVFLKDAQVSVIVNKKGEMNLSAISKNSDKKQKKKSKLKLWIKKVELENLSTIYRDYSLPKDFKIYLHKIRGTILNLSENANRKTDLDLRATVEESGYIKIKGKIDLDNIKKQTDLDLKILNIDLKILSPYAIKFTNFILKDGWINIRSKIKIHNQKLDIKNRITVGKLKISKKSNSKVSKSATAAIIALKDTKGEIEINLPIKGDIKNPKFSTAFIASSVLEQTIKSVVLAPFKIVSGILKLKDNRVNFIEFDDGEYELIPPSIPRLNYLVSRLKKKKYMNIIILNSYNKKLDTKALKELSKGKKIGQKQLQKLALNRAKKIKNYLLKKGINSRKIIHKNDYIELKKEVGTKLKVEYFHNLF